MSTASEKLKGSAKEVVGDALGDRELQQEGQQQQEKARKTEEAVELQDEADRKAREAVGHAGAEKAARED